jgi:hypothetical protein
MYGPANATEHGSASTHVAVVSRPIVVSLFPNETTSLPSPRAADSWLELLHLIGPPKPAHSKKGQPMYSPAEWPDGSPKTKAGVLRVHFGVLDLDDIAEEALFEIVSRIRCPYVAVSSWGHGSCHSCDGTGLNKKKGDGTPCPSCNGARVAPPGIVRMRVIVPFSRPVEAHEWPRFWAMFGQTIGLGYQDESCKDPNRCFFFPTHPQQPLAPPRWLHGNYYEPPLDVDDLLSRAPAPRAQHTGPLYQNAPTSAHEALSIALNAEGMQYEGAPLTVLDLRALIKKWQRSGQYKKWLSERIRQILDGEPFAEDGQRDSTLFKVCASLAEAFPHASASSLASIMAPSLEAMGLDGPGTAEAIEKLRRRQADPRLQAVGRIAELFNGRRGTPYTEDELRAFAAQMECTTEQFQRRWIIQRGRSFYIFVGNLSDDGICHEGDYIGPYTQEDAANASRRELAPAASLGVQLDLITEKNVRAKSIHELVKDYGTVATQAIIDLTADFSYYEPNKRQFVEATAPLRDLEPLYDPQIDTWLSCLAGAQYERLCEWIAAVTLLSEPCAALYLEGAKGVGKTLLALGLSRLWNMNGPTDLEQALAAFNESLCHNPLTFGDEHVPTDGRGRMRTAELREFVQGRQRVLKRKFMHPQPMVGCVRVILAANNKNLIHTSESLTQHDVLALAERVFHLPVQENAVAYLKTIKDADSSITRRWVEGDLIARHALWLRDNITIDRRNRFLVSGESTDLARTLTVNDRMKGACCNWLVAFMLNPEKLGSSTLRDRVRVENGKLYVNSQVLVEAWELYPTNEEPPPTGKIYRALADMAVGERVHKRDSSGRERHFRQIDENTLISWAEQSGYATEATLREILAKGLT